MSSRRSAGKRCSAQTERRLDAKRDAQESIHLLLSSDESAWEGGGALRGIKEMASGASDTLLFRGNLEGVPVVAKVFCAKETELEQVETDELKEAEMAPGTRLLRNGDLCELYLGQYASELVAMENSPHVLMRYMNVTGETGNRLVEAMLGGSQNWVPKTKMGRKTLECVRRTGRYAAVAISEDAGNGESLADFLEKVVRPRLERIPKGERSRPDLDVDRVLLKLVFEILYTLMILNLHGVRHGDLHVGNVLLVPEENAGLESLPSAYVPDHAGLLLLASEGTEEDVADWLLSSTWIPRHVHAPSNALIRRVAAFWKKVRRGGGGSATSAKASLTTDETKFAEACERILRDLADEGAAWYLVFPNPPSFQSMGLNRNARIFDWDWGSFLGARGVGDDRSPFVNQWGKIVGWGNSFLSANPKGDAYLFCASLWLYMTRYEWLEKLPETTAFLESISPEIDVRRQDERSVSRLIDHDFAFEVFPDAGAGEAGMRYCKGPVQFDPNTCTATVSAKQTCDVNLKDAGVGTWAPPDCAFLPPELALAQSESFEQSSQTSSLVHRRVYTGRQKAETPTHPSVCQIYGDWRVALTPARRSQLSRALTVSLVDSS